MSLVSTEMMLCIVLRVCTLTHDVLWSRDEFEASNTEIVYSSSEDMNIQTNIVVFVNPLNIKSRRQTIYVPK